MLIERIKRPLEWGDIIIVRLLRRWVAAREVEQKPLPCMVGLAMEFGQSTQLAVALDSLLQLTENCLGRPLQVECCCSQHLGPDERAVLLMIAAAPAPGQPFASPGIPHGLPGALAWAATSLKRAMIDQLASATEQAPKQCPFGKPCPEVEPRDLGVKPSILGRTTTNQAGQVAPAPRRPGPRARTAGSGSG